MIRCNHCSAEIDQTSKFCGVCGAPVNNVDVGIYKEKECLDNFHRFLKYERISWKIAGIVWLVISCVWLFLGFVMLIAAIEEGIFAAFSFMYMFIGVIYLPIAIVNLKMVKKAQHYMDIVYNDVTPVAERCGNVGMIVLSAFFNTIAMIFIIINFTRTKCSTDEINSAKMRQAQYRDNLH